MKAFFTKRKSDTTVKETVFSCKRDHLTIRGTEYRPKGENLPIAIVCHGFMAFQDTVRQYAKALAEMGYVSYCFDFCGGCVMKGKSDGKTTDMSVLTEVKDLEAVIDYAKAKSYTRSHEILLMGCSQGGFVSAITASRHKEEVSKLILFYPAFCIPDDVRAGNMLFTKFDPNNVPEIMHCGPMKVGKCYVEAVAGMDPYQEIGDYLGDVLIVHGTKDNVVNMTYIEKAYETFLENKHKNNVESTTSLKIISGGRHSFSKKHDAIAIQYLKEFLTASNGY